MALGVPKLKAYLASYLADMAPLKPESARTARHPRLSETDNSTLRLTNQSPIAKTQVTQRPGACSSRSLQQNRHGVQGGAEDRGRQIDRVDLSEREPVGKLHSSRAPAKFVRSHRSRAPSPRDVPVSPNTERRSLRPRMQHFSRSNRDRTADSTGHGPLSTFASPEVERVSRGATAAANSSQIGREPSAPSSSPQMITRTASAQMQVCTACVICHRLLADSFDGLACLCARVGVARTHITC